MNKKSYLYGMITGIVAAAFIFVVLFSVARVYGIVTKQMVSVDDNTTQIENKYEEINNKLEAIDSVLDAKYYEDIDWQILDEGAYEGYVNGLGDPYTTYFTKDEYESFVEESNGSYEGIGVIVTLGENGEDIEVLSPFTDSPGEKAGMIHGDRIMKVDGVDVTGMSTEDVVKLIKGPKGTNVVITVYRKSTDETLDLTVMRDVINMQTVSHEMLEGEIGYMIITGFEGVTYDQFMEAYNDLENQGQKGMIIDLRNNPGGYVQIVSKIADQLLGKGLIVYTQDKNGKKEELYSDDENQFEKPLVILVNENSASASEILAGAVKDHNAGTIVGTKTFGKGVVQGTYQFTDGSALKVTIAKYYTPNGNYIHGVGIEPDIAIELPEELQMQLVVERDQDTQFKKAVEVIKLLIAKEENTDK